MCSGRLLTAPSVFHLLQLVSEPCDPSKAADITFDASFSRDSSGRPLSSYHWSQTGSNDVVLAAAISAANAVQGGSPRWAPWVKAASACCNSSSGKAAYSSPVAAFAAALSSNFPCHAAVCADQQLPLSL